MHKIAHENLLGLKIRNYTFIKVIGQGNYARVYEAINQLTSDRVAAKVFPKELFKKNPKLNELVKTEISVLKDCKNQNVVKYVDNFMSGKNFLIFMELCSGGQLQEYLDKRQKLSEDQATTFLKQIINGFKGLHQAKAMHRDFKASNVLLHQNICKIADLGFAKLVEQEETTRTLLGSGLTMAPQVHQQKSYGRKADLWSVAIVFYQLIYGQYPFKGYTDHQILKNIITSRPKYDKVKISDKARDFIERCLVVDPKIRISWKEVYTHPLIVEQNTKQNVSTSYIRLQQNKSFYDRDSLPEEKIQIEKYQEIQEENIEKIQKNDITDKIEQNKAVEKEQKYKLAAQQINKIQLAIKQYEIYYLRRRNNIMFIFNHIVSNIIELQSIINANHSITLFILCKKAYLDIKKFYLQLSCNKNILPSATYFEEFVETQQYKNIKELVESDVSLINLQIRQYCLILPKVLNEEIRNQLHLQHTHHSNWASFVIDIVDSYQNELSGSFEDISPIQKKTVIKLIESLRFYKTLEDDTNVQLFEKHIQELCYLQKESQIRQRWIQKLTGYQQ